jgi:glycogen debranching enzyme
MPEEVVKLREHYYIVSTSSRIDDRTRVLKHGNTFAVFDRFGDIERFGSGELGIYHHDTRFLSRLVLKIEKERPLPLSSTIKQDNSILTVDAMNPDLPTGGEVIIPHGTIHVFRSKVLWNGTCHERIRIHNFGRSAVSFALYLSFDSDFADIFEVRGIQRTERGRRLPAQVDRNVVVHAYEGLDANQRRTRIHFHPPPSQLDDESACYQVQLEPHGQVDYLCAIRCELDAANAADQPARNLEGDGVERREWYPAAAKAAVAALRQAKARSPELVTTNEPFNRWVDRSLADLCMLQTETRHGPYPYAGVPWFCTVFGRDGIITALECLSFMPEMARGVLNYLAEHQAAEQSAKDDAQPGKILHETRAGEMALLGTVPFKHYYGTIDATPLFIMLAGAYYERTGDDAFARKLWPHVERGLAWINQFGDLDGDGFVEYAAQSPQGLVHQGWKDSHDSVFHDDGSDARGPIALCEVQGYVYGARHAASSLARALGNESRAQELADEATTLRERFDQAFWCEDLATYALALDGDKRPCRVRSSNAGHCLFTGIATSLRARRVMETLVSEASFSGWGIRTLAVGEARYNPMSYHNGSIWPHDNALIAAGFSRYGFKEQAAAVFSSMLEASICFDLHRLPELFCAFPKRTGESPTLYPVACAPQAWAAGAVLLLLESCLGLKVVGSRHQVVLSDPVLPASLQRLSIRNLPVGEGKVDLLLTRHDRMDVGVEVLRREGSIDVSVLK